MPSAPVDSFVVAPISAEFWTAIALVAALVVLTSLYALARLYREQTRLHDFKNRVTILRRQYAKRMAEMEAVRMLMVKRGNIQKEITQIGEEAGEGTEIQTITMFKLMKAFEKVMQKVYDRNNKPQHVVYSYNYTMEGSREYMMDMVMMEKTVTFEKIFEVCENRIHAIFLFLSMLELVQQKYMTIITGEGRNNFIIEWNEHRNEDIAEDMPFTEE